MAKRSTKKVDPLSFLPLHPLEARILLLLSEGEAHAYKIVKEIEQRDASWTTIFPANLYRRIRDLLAKGLIELVHDSRAESGRARRTFRITELGAEVARCEWKRLEALIQDFRELPQIGAKKP